MVTIVQKTAHNGSKTIDDYINQWGFAATGLSSKDSGYVLSGIQAGSKIGTYGWTGTTTGPHLHVEYLLNGNAQDPLTYFDDAGISYKITSDAKISSGYESITSPLTDQSYFVDKLLSSDYNKLSAESQADIGLVFSRNNIWKTASDPVKQSMIEYLRKNKPEVYAQWIKLPTGVQKQYFPW